MLSFNDSASLKDNIQEGVSEKLEGTLELRGLKDHYGLLRSLP